MQGGREREHFMQSTARTLGLSGEAVRESLARLPKDGALTKPSGSDAGSKNVQEVPRRSAVESRSEQLRAVIQVYPDTPLAERVKTEYSRIIGALAPSEPLPEPALFVAEQTFGEEPQGDAADELLHAFEEAVIREAYQGAVNDLRRAEAAGDAARVTSTQALCAELSARLSAFGA